MRLAFFFFILFMGSCSIVEGFIIKNGCNPTCPVDECCVEESGGRACKKCTL